MDFLLPKCATDCGIKEKFWLLDDANAQSPAHVTFQPCSEAIAEVQNPRRRHVTFRAIDQCVEIVNQHQQEVTRCDCMLQYDEVYHFIELKARKRGRWQAKGFEQLRATVLLFLQSHPDVRPKAIRAQLCNCVKPSVNTMRSEQLKRFKSEAGILPSQVFMSPQIII